MQKNITTSFPWLQTGIKNLALPALTIILAVVASPVFAQDSTARRPTATYPTAESATTSPITPAPIPPTPAPDTVAPVTHTHHGPIFPVRIAGNLLFPAISDAPETSIALGITGMRLFHADSATRLSRIGATALYTLDKQYTIQGNLLIYTPHNQYLLKGSMDYSKFPEYYYGIGDKTQSRNKSLLSYQDYKGDLAIMKRLVPHTYLGIKAAYSDYYNVAPESGYPPLPDTLTGKDGGTTTGVGITAIFDNRDHPISAHTGWYAELSFMSSEKFLGSDFQFTSFDADLRKFIPLSSNSVLAFQAIGSIKSGQVPFLQLSCLGGDDMMRGVYTGRYRDKDLVAAQVEFRKMIYRRWGFVVFAAGGKVGSDLKTLNNDQLQDSYGIGLRRMMSKNDRVSLRMDVGVADGQANLYVSIGEAF